MKYVYQGYQNSNRSVSLIPKRDPKILISLSRILGLRIQSWDCNH